MNLAKAFGSLADNKNLVRTRSFHFNGHTFKVRVPLTSELDAMQARLKEPAPELEAKYYAQLTNGLEDNKELLEQTEGVEVKDDDILIDGRSLRELAQGKALSERRVVEMFKMLVAEDPEFDMSTITYDMIEELFPFSIQIEMMELIAKTISPDYKEIRGK